MQREACWHEQNLCALQCQGAIELRETQVIADCQAKSDTVDLCCNYTISRHNTFGFVMLLAVGKVYIEQVNLAILGDNLTITIYEHRSIMEFSDQLSMLFNNAAPMHDHPMLTSFLLQQFNCRTGDGLCHRVKTKIGAKIAPVLRQCNELCAQTSGPIYCLLYSC